MIPQSCALPTSSQQQQAGRTLTHAATCCKTMISQWTVQYPNTRNRTDLIHIPQSNLIIICAWKNNTLWFWCLRISKCLLTTSVAVCLETLCQTVFISGAQGEVPVVIFFFTNKLVAGTSHACGIKVGSNKDYLFSCCFESIEICFRLPAHRPGCCCFLLSWLLITDTGNKETSTVTLLSRAPQLLPASSNLSQPSQHSSSCLQPPHGPESHQTTCGWQNVSTAEISLPLRIYLSLSNFIMIPCWA